MQPTPRPIRLREHDVNFFVRLTWSQISPIRWVRWSSTRRQSLAILITDCSTPAEAITDSAMAGDPTRANPVKPSDSTPSSTAILRFDPRSPKVTGGMKGLGDYTIPMANKFAADGDPKTLGEIYAYGFRNAHRLSWDTDGTMFASDIGMNQNRRDQHRPQRRELRLDETRRIYLRTAGGVAVALNELFPLPPEVLRRASKGWIHLSGRDLRSRRGTRRHRRLRLSRPHRRASGQVRFRRHTEWTSCLRRISPR